MPVTPLKLKLRITLTREMLGTASADPDIYIRHLQDKLPAEEKENGKGSTEPSHASADELEMLPNAETDGEETVKDMLERHTTVFRRTPEGEPCLLDYMFKGFFKSAMGALRRVDKKSVPTAYRKTVDEVIFVYPWQVVIHLPEGAEVQEGEQRTRIYDHCTRPLRAPTPQGERVALARSETVPIGSYMDIELESLDPKLEDVLIRCLDYGARSGLGAWRNAGHGRFSYEILDEEGGDAEE